MDFSSCINRKLSEVK